MSDNGSGMERIFQLEKLYTSKSRGVHRNAFSTEALLDILVVLYDECNTTVMKRDKRVLDFLEIGKISKSFNDNNLMLMFINFCSMNVLCKTWND